MINIANISVDNSLRFTLIAGPCQLESLDHSRRIVETLLESTVPLGIPLVFKGSFDKANRSSIHSQRGLGIDDGLDILQRIQTEFSIPVLTDIHEIEQAELAAQVVDVIQIPAFLCRQTSLLEATAQYAVRWGRAVNVKKGQFMAPWDMPNVVEKFTQWGLKDLMLCERGTTFGYNSLVNDFTGLPVMAQTGFPVIFDATHSAQKPGGQGTSSGGNREMVPYLARAALAVGVAGLFLETHEDPDNAPSDGPNMVRLDQMNKLLEQFKQLDTLCKGFT